MTLQQEINSEAAYAYMAIMRLLAQVMTMIWGAIQGRNYRLVTAATLPATTWTSVPGDVPATAGTASKTVTIGSVPGGTFFQVELVP